MATITIIETGETHTTENSVADSLRMADQIAIMTGHSVRVAEGSEVVYHTAKEAYEAEKVRRAYDRKRQEAVEAYQRKFPLAFQDIDRASGRFVPFDAYMAKWEAEQTRVAA